MINKEEVSVCKKCNLPCSIHVDCPLVQTWHTGTPTEEGEYVVWMRFPPDCTREEQGSLLVDWDKENGFTFDHLQVSKIGEVVAWMPIPLFED